MIISCIQWTLYSIIAVVVVYAIRHYVFTLQRLFGHQRKPFLDVDTADWLPITVVIPCHNEQAVIGQSLVALLAADYPTDKIVLVPVDDRSTDRTGEIIREIAARHPQRILPLFRKEGRPGKAAVLKYVMPYVKTEVLLIFDADYLPSPGLLKRLATPFFDPEVGAVMGRVVPFNVTTNWLTRLLDLERTGGYQVDQQARMNLELVPQYGGTVGGVRRSALEKAGGWDENTLAEDTDATFKLLLDGWITVYENRAECYEEVPQEWPDRLRQIKRWATGHNQSLAHYARTFVMRGKHLPPLQRLDGLLLLCIYALAPIMVVGWLLALILFYAGVETGGGIVTMLAFSSYLALGNFAPFFEIAAATRLDGSSERARLLPLLMLGYLMSCASVTQAALSVLWPRQKRQLIWHKTPRAGDAP